MIEKVIIQKGDYVVPNYEIMDDEFLISEIFEKNTKLEGIVTQVDLINFKIKIENNSNWFDSKYFMKFEAPSFELQGKYAKAIVYATTCEQSTISQIIQMLDQPAFADAVVRIMPDTHKGTGCVIGFTGNLGTKIPVNIVGVDIGCGVIVVNLGKQEKLTKEWLLENLEPFIREEIPHGHSVNREIKNHTDITKEFSNKLQELSKKTDSSFDKNRVALGSLGGGNHFIEIDIDDEGNRYLVIHSGSRNLGLRIAKYHHKKAIEYIDESIKNIQNKQNRSIGLLKKSGDKSSIQQVLDTFKKEKEIYSVPKELAYLEGDLAKDYIEDMKFVQKYADINREIMAIRICEFLKLEFNKLDSFTSIHNYIDFKDNIIRKGAISARYGEKVIIPINMKDGSIIAMGKGNNEWNNSAPHGAGRVLSRSEAKEILSMEDFNNDMKDVATNSVCSSTLDESPRAYKPIEEIKKHIVETVVILNHIKPIYNFKDKSKKKQYYKGKEIIKKDLL